MTDYQQAVVAALQALGKVVDWKQPRAGRRETLHLDAVDSDIELIVIAPRCYLPGISAANWRARRMPEDPKKAAATIVDRTAALVSAREQYRREQDAYDRREQRRQVLQAAFGDRARVGAYGEIVFTPPLTPDQACAIVALLGKDPTQ